MKQSLEEKLSFLPGQPGCYLMKNKYKEIIYVGKAKNLKQRVSSYFTGAHDFKTSRMVAQIDDFDLIITNSEKEALILEINLIKKHHPRFNIIFKDDKSYPYLKMNRQGLPKVEISRDRKQQPNYYYFGPYPNAKAARDMASLLNESLPMNFELRPNTQAIYSKFNREPIDFTEAEIEAWRKSLLRLLNGQVQDFIADLEKQMQKASQALNFEYAQLLKEKIAALEYISDRQQVQFPLHEEFDMFHYYYHQGYIAIAGFFVRNGRLLERSMAVEACTEEPADALFSFIVQFYENQPQAKKVYIPLELDRLDLQEFLEADVLYAHRGKKRQLLELAEKNAKNQMEDQFALLRSRQNFKDEALLQLQKKLNLQENIERIEVFDVSHLSGSYTVASCVVFDHGEPNKQAYRRYRLSVGNDDTAAIEEVVYRRYFRLLQAKEKLPDLVVVDGGQGQLNAAKQVLRSLGLDLNIMSLVKDDRHRTEAILNQQGEFLGIKSQTALYAFLVRIQDEVHRFAINYHKKLRSKAMKRSILDEVKGLGEVRKKKLYREFKSLKGIKEASLEDLKAHLPKQVALDLYDLLRIDWSDQKDD